ncbi:hypothetical protein [Chryseobacterium herbae]|uniref:Uncharacterized protein n=1 Tax=Chryseobacterium herbae TaxID=2976476 RepID=A0ABT2IP96_9FLAO|nr:hypothetical protein [Chryseobacterium sp. pc1-10]MCT2560510.1 hypothetical protein [Chryseobacterium sp. pc1-10]
MTWLRDDEMLDLDNLPEPSDLLNEIVDDIEIALASLIKMKDSLLR